MANDVINVRIEGGAEIAAWLKSIGATAEQVVEQATLAAAEVVRQSADAKAPSPNSIEKEVQKASAERVEVDVAPGHEKWYYRFAETGTQPHEVRPKEAGALMIPGGAHPIAGAKVGGMAATPFLRPAADTQENAAADAAGDVFKQAMDK